MSKKSLSGKELTVDLIVSKTKSNNLDSIKNLNLWGNELEDLSILDRMPNLEVISLSVNKIVSLKDFRTCNRLQELYLRKNCISDIREIRYLMKLPTLKVLWLHDNPCAHTENYREIVIKHLPNLQKLDNHPVTPEEKQSSQHVKTTFTPFSEQEQKGADKMPYPRTAPTESKGFEKVERVDPRGLEKGEYATNYEGKVYEPQKKHYQQGGEDLERNKNILMAVLSLMKELDPGSLELVKREADSLSRNF